MSIKTKVNVEFELESLVTLNKDKIAEKVGELLTPEESDNWFEDSDTYALYDANSLTIEIK